MPSTHRTRFLVPGETARGTPQSSSSPSTSSTRSLPSPSPGPQQQEEEPSFTLHPLLQTSQEPVAEGIVSRILWDVREDPLKAAQYVENLGTKLSQETLDEFATTPPLPLLKVKCEFPLYWECFVSAGKRPLGGAGTRNTVPAYPPPASHNTLVHGRSSSASIAQPRPSGTPPPPRPTLRVIPLPLTSPPPGLPIATPPSVVNVVPVSAPQVQEPREVGITVGDLLSALYNYLDRHGVRGAELESLSGKQRMRVEDAADKRRRASFVSETTSRPSMAAISPSSPATFSPVSAVPSTSSAAITTSATSSGPPVEGMKQVDKLMKHTWFAGLTVAPEKNTVSLTLKTPTATN